MNKAVLISIPPEWCELIASGQKTIELRKTRPNLDTPFKCYIYQTGEYISANVLSPYAGKRRPGKVIGEFTCTKIDRYVRVGTMRDNLDYLNVLPDFYTKPINFDSLCLSSAKLKEYGKGKQLYGWHISNLHTYAKPKELREFRRYEPYVEWTDGYPLQMHEIKRAPPSWMYVEETA